MPVVVIEGAVQNPDVPDAMIMNGLNPFPDCFYGQTAYRFFSAAYTKSTGVETATGCLQLYERFAPVEQLAALGWDK